MGVCTPCSNGVCESCTVAPTVALFVHMCNHLRGEIYSLFVQWSCTLVFLSATCICPLMTTAYCRILVYFSSWLDGEDYANNEEIPMATLEAIAAKKMVQWFKYCAYGTATPSEANRPIHTCASSLLYWKKALSSFMPQRNVQWNDIGVTHWFT